VSYERIEELADFTPVREAIREAMGTPSPRLAQALTLRIGLEDLLGAPMARALHRATTKIRGPGLPNWSMFP